MRRSRERKATRPQASEVSISALCTLVADDHEVVRRGLCDLLQSHAGWEVCAEAADGREALDNAQQLKPDIVILEIGMPNLNDLTAARQMLRNDTYQKILFLTIADSEQTPIEGTQTARGERQQ
jgi:DNA-binding NarL/FixJ family response regulator